MYTDGVSLVKNNTSGETGRHESRRSGACKARRKGARNKLHRESASELDTNNEILQQNYERTLDH